MGMSASQARLLTLTARIHDVENEAQRIQNQKLLLANDSDRAYNNYLDAVNKKYVQNAVFNPETGEFNFEDSNFSSLVDAGFGFKVKQNAVGNYVDCYSFNDVSNILGLSPDVADSKELLMDLMNHASVLICTKGEAETSNPISANYNNIEGTSSIATSGSEFQQIDFSNISLLEYSSCMQSKKDIYPCIYYISSGGFPSLNEHSFGDLKVKDSLFIQDGTLEVSNSFTSDGTKKTVSVDFSQDPDMTFSELNDKLKSAELRYTVAEYEGKTCIALTSTVMSNNPDGEIDTNATIRISNKVVRNTECHDYSISETEPLINSTDFSLDGVNSAEFKVGDKFTIEIEGTNEVIEYTLKQGDSIRDIVDYINSQSQYLEITIDPPDISDPAQNSGIGLNWKVSGLPNAQGIVVVGYSDLAGIFRDNLELEGVQEVVSPPYSGPGIQYGQLVGNTYAFSGKTINSGKLSITVGSNTKYFEISGDKTWDQLIDEINNSSLDVTASFDGNKLTVTTNSVSTDNIIFDDMSGGNLADLLAMSSTPGQATSSTCLLSSNAVVCGDPPAFGEVITPGELKMHYDGATYSVNLTSTMTYQGLINEIKTASYNKLTASIVGDKFIIEPASGVGTIGFSSPANNYSNFFNLLGYRDFQSLVPTMVATNVKLREMQDDSVIAQAEAEYEAALRKIDNKDKKYDTELAAIDNQRSALTKQLETLNTCIDENVDRTFKLFS